MLHSPQRKIDAESAFGYYEWVADLGTHTSKTAIISKGIPRTALWKKVFIEPRNGSYTIPFVRTATE